MNKFNTFLVAIGMVLLTFAAQAQLSFSLVPSDQTPDLGDQITVDVVVNDQFQEIVSFQYTITWDETMFSYQGVSNFGLPGLGAGNFGATQASNGVLTVSWFDPLAASQTINTDSTIFTLTFDVVATAAATSTISFANSPVTQEIIAQDSDGNLTDLTSSTVFNDTTIDIAGGADPGTGIECNFTGFGLLVTSDSADTGDPVCLDVIACNFSEIVSMQYTMEFDPNLLQFDSLTNFNLANLDAGSFGTTNIGNGFIVTSWLDSLGAGITIPDETVIYSVCFTAIGAGGSLDTVAINDALAPIEVTDANSAGADIGLESVDGMVTITGDASSAVSVSASCEQGNPGDTVTVAVSVSNFDSISGMQMSMLWDPAIIDFLDTEWTGQLPGSPTFNTSATLTDAGKLALLWDDPLGGTSSVMDDSVIFNVRYVIVGDVTDVSTVSFTDDPTSIEVTQVVNGTLQTVPLARIQGKVEVIGEGVLGFIIEDATGCTNDTICIPVTVDNFNEIVSMQFDFTWNSAELEFIQTQDYNSVLEGLNAGSFNQYAPDKLRFSWSQGLLEPRTLTEDNDTLYSLCFEILGADGTTADVGFDETQTVEVSGGSTIDLITNFTLDDGVVSVNCDPVGVPMTVSDTMITNVLCNGESTGAIALTLSDVSGTATFNWSNGANTQNISGLAAGTYSVTITDNNTTINETYTVTQPASALAVSMSSTDVTINGGSDGTATATPSGGTSPYTYNWSNGGNTAMISSLSAGTYTVTITDDNGCTITDQVVVSEPGALSATINASNVNCNGGADGSATVSVTGGVQPYTYNWSNGGNTATINNLSAGSYTVTITDDNSATTTATINISEPAELTVSGVVTDESALNANNGAIDITPGGGTSPYSYSWSNGASTQDIDNLAPGNYTVTITDANNCTLVETFTVNAFDAPVITVINVIDVTCNGESTGSIDISVSGGVSPYDYDWSNGASSQDISNLAAGNYTITVTDQLGTTAVQTITVSQGSAIVVTLDNQQDVDCNGASTGSISVSVSGGAPVYSYNWGGGIISEDPSGLSAGTYTLTVTDNNGCTSVGPTVTITEPTPIVITVNSVTNVNCFGESTGAIDVGVQGGTPGYTYNWSNGNVVQDPVGLPAGNYTLTVTDAAGCTMTSTQVMITEPAPFTANATSTNISCNGDNDGSITLIVSGGTPGYNYNWTGGLPNQPNQTNLSAGTYSVTVTDALGCTAEVGPITLSQPAAIEIESTVINASGNNDDGSINLTVTGGTPAYNYAWNTGDNSPNLSGLASGCYVVTVTDTNGCSASDSIKVGGIIIIEAEVVNTTCADNCDGSIDINISGGIAPYIYSWSGPDVVGNAEDQSNLCAGNYSVTVVDNNGTQAVQSFTISSPSAIEITNSNVINESGSGCNGSIDITVIGGTLPYTYQWSNGATSEDVDDLCKGEYSVTVIDANGCVLTSEQFVVAPAPLVVAMSSMTPADCTGDTGGEACLSVLGGCAPYIFELGNVTQISESGENICFADLAAGTYTVDVTDSGNPQMTVSQTFTIATPDPIVIESNIINNTDATGMDCDGAIDITVTGGAIPYTYLWSNGAISEDIINLCSGGPTFSVTVTDANGCNQVLSGMVVELGLNIQVVSTTDISCMGDCNGLIDIAVTGGIAPYEYTWSNSGNTQDINNLCAGSYDVTVTDDNGMMATFLGISIAEPSAELSVSTGTVIQPIGNNANGSINLDISGGWGGYTIQWSNGAMGNPIGGLIADNYTATVTDANGCIEVITVDLNAFDLFLSASLTEPSCNGEDDGQIEIVVTGSGSGNYLFEWDNGQEGELAFGLEAGTYCVTVADNEIGGLVVEECFDLGQPEPLTINPIVTPPSGPADGSIDANVSGGTMPYVYTWTTGDNTPIAGGLTAGSYGLIVTDANGCEAIVSQIEVGGPAGDCYEGRKVISPNGDGKNDEFIISCAEGVDNNLKVFNRWGQMVYEADNYDNSWMGTDASGTVLPESGYFWVFEYQDNGQTKQIKGAFTLLRGDN